MRKINKQIAAISLGAVAITGTGVAYAYWTTSGTGAGQATTTTDTAITVNQTSTITTLSPTTSVEQAAALVGTFTNTNTAPVKVTQVNVAIAEGTGGTVWQAGCTAADYSLVQPAAQTGLVPVGTNVGSWTGASIRLVSTAANQDGCKNQVVKLAYTTTTAPNA